jgi:SAM-dependent methyltransferase
VDTSTRSSAAVDYVLDVPYPRKFVPQIAPPLLRLVAAMNGLPAPPEDDFDYCELGSACGDTLTLLAAANPRARFVGVDLNPTHTAVASSLARRGGLQNVEFVTRDFAELRSHELPALDFLVAHGVLSWVGPDRREALRTLARDRLKPGGLLYVSYNAMPGWAAVEPLRRLMLHHTAGMRGSTLDRAREAFAYVERLADAGAGYFANNPTARSMVGLMRAGGLPYVVHEYFNAHMQPEYFADVAREMEAHGLRFVGQVPLHLNVRELAAPPSVKKIADATPDRMAFEELAGFADNAMFRSDVYVKGKVQRAESETRLYFEGTPFGTMAPAAQVRREPKVSSYTLDFKGKAYDAIINAIAEAPATAMELAQRPETASLGQSRIGDLLRNLVLGGQVVPMRIEARRGPSGGGYRIRLPFNDGAIDDVLAGEGPLVLASPITGSGVHVSLLEAIGLRLLTGVQADGRAAWIRDYVSKREMPLVTGDRKIKDADELARVMSKEIERMTPTLPKLAALGILAPVSAAT